MLQAEKAQLESELAVEVLSEIAWVVSFLTNKEPEVERAEENAVDKRTRG